MVLPPTSSFDFTVMPAVQYRLVSWRPSLQSQTIRPTAATDDSASSELEQKLAAGAKAADRVVAGKPAALIAAR